MAAYCLPKKFSSAFLAALKDGRVNPAELADMSSAERRTFFEGIVGVENAEEVNALFESKLLLKNVKQGLVTWAKTTAGVTEPTRRDLLAKIGRMPEGLLNPVDQSKFLSDLAATKLGVTVTAEEAKQIFDLAKLAEEAKSARIGNDATSWIKYGRAQIKLDEYINSLKPRDTRWSTFLREGIIAIGRALVTTGDLSAATQMIARVSSPEWWRGVRNMVDYVADQKNFDDLQAYIRGHPDYDVMKKAGLSFGELRGDYTVREEMAPPKFLEDFNEHLKARYGAPNVIAASNRAFVGMGNYVRVKAAENYLAALRLAGEEISGDNKIVREMMEVVNNTTARGKWGTAGSALEKSAPLASVLLFAPRKFAATIRLFNPWYYVNPKISPLARKAQLRQLLGAMAVTGTTVGMFKLMGYDVETDPIHTNFMRVGSGITAFDFTNGNATYLRFWARFLTGYSISARDNLTEFGEGYKPTTRLTTVADLLRSRLAPWSSSVATAMHGSDPAGRPFSITQTLADNTIPMTISNFIDLALHDPENVGAILLSPLTIFGVGMQVQTRPSGRFDVWGDPTGTDHSQSPVDQKLRSLGIYPDLPEHSIRGVKLTDALYDEYQYLSGEQMRERVGAAIQTPGFDDLRLGEQEDILRDTWNSARDDARDLMMAQHPEIAVEADRLKEERLDKGSPAAVARRAQ